MPGRRVPARGGSAVQGYAVLLSDDPQGFGRALGAALADDPATFCRVDMASSALEMEHLLKSEREVHLLVLDLALTGLGGPAGAERLARWWRRRLPADLRQVPPGTRPTPGPGLAGPRRRLVVVSPLGDDALVRQVFEWGADYFVVRPFQIGTLVERLRELLSVARPVSRRPAAGARRLRELESRIIRHLEALGVPPHYKGRAYLKDAIAMVVEDRELLSRVTKELYPRIASLHHTSPFKVERSIRHAIESTVQRGNLERIHELFTDLMDERRTRPTNSAFIARMAERIREELAGGA